MVNANDELKSKIISTAQAKGYSSDKKVDSKHAREIAKAVGKPQPLVKAILFEAGLYEPASEVELQQLQSQGAKVESAEPKSQAHAAPDETNAEPKLDIEVAEKPEGSKADTTSLDIGFAEEGSEGLLRDEEGESTAQRVRREILEESGNSDDSWTTMSEVEAEAEKRAAEEQAEVMAGSGSQLSRTLFIVLLVIIAIALTATLVIVMRGS